MHPTTLTLLLVWGAAFTLQCTATESPSTSEVEDFDAEEADFDNAIADIEDIDCDDEIEIDFGENFEGEEDFGVEADFDEGEDFDKEERGNMQKRQASIIHPRPPPPATEQAVPKRVSFAYTTEADANVSYSTVDHGEKLTDGSLADELFSEWTVVTRSGYEYSGSRSALRWQFLRAKEDLAMSDIESNFDLQGVTPSEDEPSSSDLGFSKKMSVFPPDTRQKVSRPYLYPWSAMGQVDTGCTGTFIGPRHVLTAGHCVFNRRTKKWYRNLNFRRAKNCDPNQGTLYRWRYAISVKGWTKYGWRSYDYAMIVVDRASPFRMSFGYRTWLLGWIVNINGYPGDKPGRCMWHSNCRIQFVFFKRLFYRCDTYRGNSGSAVYVYWKRRNRRVIYCIHATGGLFNGCTRITKSRFHQLKDWIAKY